MRVSAGECKMQKLSQPPQLTLALDAYRSHPMRELTKEEQEFNTYLEITGILQGRASHLQVLNVTANMAFKDDFTKQRSMKRQPTE